MMKAGAQDPNRLPLVTLTLEVERGERAAGARSARPPPGLEPSELLPPSLEIEFLVEVASLVRPDQLASAMVDVQLLSGAAGIGPEARLTARATHRSGGEVGVSSMVEGIARLDAPRGDARVVFAHSHPPAPVSPRGAQLLTRTRGRTASAELLYARSEESVVFAADRLQVVRWTAGAGLGRLMGEIQHQEQPLGLPNPSRMPTAPAVLEGMMHLSQWLWYAIAGQGSRPRRIDRLAWYRLPRQGEALVAEAVLCGQREGQPCFDLSAYGTDGILTTEVRGLQLEVYPLETEGTSLRPAWQSRRQLLLGETLERLPE